MGDLLFILLIISGSVYAAVKCELRFEETMPVFSMGLVMVLFSFGLFGILQVGMLAISILAFCLYMLTISELCNRQKLRTVSQFLITPGSVFFVLICIMLSVCNDGKVASQWDEFSHWVDIVKAVTAIDDFGTNPAANSVFQSYPPAMILFQYSIQKMNQWVHPGIGFSEWRVFYGYQLFSVIVMLPFFRNVQWNQMLRWLFLAIIVLLAPLLFFNMYNTAYIDLFVGLLFGAGMAMVLLWPSDDVLGTATVCLICAVLTLSKDVGILFALTISLAYCTGAFFCGSKTKNGTFGFLPVTPWVATFLPKFLWEWEIRRSGCVKIFGNRISWSVLLEVILGRDTSYRAGLVHSYWNALCDKTVSLKNLPVSLNYISLLIIFAILLGCLYFFYKRNHYEQIGKLGAVLGCSAFALVAYVVGLCIIYMFKFSEYEATRFASMERYLNIPFLGIWLFILLSAEHLASSMRRTREIELCLILVIILCVPVQNFIMFTQRDYVRESQWVRAPYETLRQQIQIHCDGNDTIYFISQENKGFDFWVSRFNARPNHIEGAWSIGEPFYDGDVWTENISQTAWRSMLLKDYDYVALYKINAYFLEQYGGLFEKPEEITVNTLYRINRESGMLQKCELK